MRPKPWEMRLPLLALTIAVPLFVFGAIAEDVVEGKPFALDRAILVAMRMPDSPATPIGPFWLPEAARDLTSLGSFLVIGLILFSVVGYLLLERRRGDAWWILSAVLGGILLNDGIKLVIGRPRPDVIDPAVAVFSSSFPSGHASLSAIAYLTLGALLARTHRSVAMRVFVMSLAVAITTLVGLSRIYLGVHYPSDVLAGWCIGSAWAVACWAIALWLQSRGRIEPPSAR